MNSLYDSEVIRMEKIDKKEEIKTLLNELETELANLPFRDSTQVRQYKFGQYVTALNISVDKVNWAFQKLKKKVTDLLSTETQKIE